MSSSTSKPSSSTVSTIHFVSLGCPKNRVDSEVMLGLAETGGFAHVGEAAEAEVIVVNTCGFIDSAKQESIETILEMAQMKHQGKCQRLVVTGCLSQRYHNELSRELPEVDHFLGSSDMLAIKRVLAGGADRILVGNPADWVVSATDPRTVSSRGASAYVKIAEGCNRNCSFCVIPKIRGKQRSRSVDDVVREVTMLAEAGVLEVNLVSQDTIAYGSDLEHGRALPELVRAVAEVPSLQWVRLFYLSPEKLTEPVVELMAQHPRVVPYVDMPLQHAADGMLRRMRRGHGGARLRQQVEFIRKHIPEVTFRTAFIVGHPGETDEAFAELCEFVSWAEFDRVGVFHYSDEEESGSYQFDAKVPAELAKTRAEALMGIQQSISRKKNQALVGRRLQVLVEGASDESDWVMAGRHPGQAPDIDGQVYLSGGEAWPGEMVEATITQASNYDLVGEIAERAEPTAAARSEHPSRNQPMAYRFTDGRRVQLTTLK